jgi:adenosine kinase
LLNYVYLTIKKFGFNLPSFYFIENYLEDIKKLFEYADIVFANAAEAMFLSTLLNIQNDGYDLGNLCVELSKLPKANKNKNRVVIITSGPNPAFVTEFNFNTNAVEYSGSFSPPYVKEESIVDTNGAGDAFAGGFMASLVKNKSLEECMRAGHWSASIIIQERGCQIPLNIHYNDQKSN